MMNAKSHAARVAIRSFEGRRMSFNYQITVQPIAETPDAATPVALAFSVTNHDDLLKIVERVQALQVLPASEVAEFSVGLKLLTEVLLRHRKDPLFSDLWPQMSEFMRKLKSVPRADNPSTNLDETR